MWLIRFTLFNYVNQLCVLYSGHNQSNRQARYLLILFKERAFQITYRAQMKHLH